MSGTEFDSPHLHHLNSILYCNIGLSFLYLICNLKLLSIILFIAELLDGQDESNIILQENEHSEYMLVHDISNIDKIVEYLYDTIEHANIYDLGSKIIKKAKKDKI